MWYKNIAGRFFGLVIKHVCDGRMDGQNYDSQDHASIARAVKTSAAFYSYDQTPFVVHLLLYLVA